MFAPPPGAPMSFADIFEQVSPAVVSINVTSKAEPAQPRRIPGLPFDIVPRSPDGDDGQNDGPQRQQSAGSGFFISSDGYLVTNNHVVENADEIKVVLKDGTELPATIIGRDEGTDLAVVKVSGKSFKFVDFENTAKPRVGDWVITIGNPFGLGGTATAGIISAYGRDLRDSSSTFVDYIQIDAPINRGNSGGPSFDIYGRVIGVNTAIFSPTGGSVGIGFAIPADIAEATVKQLISGKKVTRGYIGATIQNFTAEMGEAQGMPGQKGAIVADLVPGGPASKAGVQTGDVVVAVNGDPVTNSRELTRGVAKGRPGDPIRLEVFRDGRKRVIDVKSGTRPMEKDLASNQGLGDDDPNGAPNNQAEPAKQVILGLTLAPLDGAARSRYKIGTDVQGVLIEGVKSNSDAAEKGLKRGDVVTRVANIPVTSVSDVAAQIEKAKKSGRSSVLIGFNSGGRSGFLPLKLQP